MESYKVDLNSTEEDRLYIQQSYARTLRLLRKKENSNNVKINELVQQNQQLQEDNLMIEKELQNNRTNQGNEIYLLQCNLEKYKNLLKEKDHNTEILLKETQAMEKELLSVKEVAQSARPVQRTVSPLTVSTFDCSALLFLPLHLYPQASLSPLTEYCTLLEHILLNSPCLIQSKGSFPNTEKMQPRLNPHSYPILHDVELLPYFSIEWDSSLMSYEQFDDRVIQPIYSAICPLLDTQERYPVSQLILSSRSSLESLFDHDLLVPDISTLSKSQMLLLLLDNGVQQGMIKYWKTNPLVGSFTILKHFEHLNRSRSLLKALELLSSETLRNQFKETSFALESRGDRVLASSGGVIEDLSKEEERNPFNSLQSLIQELKLGKEMLFTENKNLRSELACQKENIIELEKMISDMRTKVEENSPPIEIERPHQEEKQSQDEVLKLQSYVRELEETNRQSTLALTDLRKKVGTLGEIPDKVLSDCGVNTDLVADQITSIHTSDHQENENENRIHSLENDLILERQLFDTKRQLFDTNAEEFRRRIADLESINRGQTDQISELQTSLRKMQEEGTLTKESLETTKIQLNEKEKQLQEKDALLSSLRSTDETKVIEGMSTEIKKLCNEIAAIQKENVGLSTRNSTLEIEHRRQIDASIHLNQTIKSLNGSIVAKDSELVESKEAYALLEDQFKELKIRLNNAQTDNESLRVALRKVNDDMQKLLKENNKYEYTQTELTKLTQSQEANLVESKNLLATNTALLAKKETELQALKVENEKMLQQLNETLNARRDETFPPSPRQTLDISPGKTNKRLEIDETFSPDYSPPSPVKSSRSRGKQQSLMSKSVPLPAIETEESENAKSKKSSPSRRQVYYKGVPIEDVPIRGDDLNELEIIEPKRAGPKKSMFIVTTPHPVHPTDGVVQGLEGMKRMRNINSQEYRRHTEQYLQTASANPILTPLAKNSSSTGTFEGLLGAEPTKKDSDRLPSISRDGSTNFTFSKESISRSNPGSIDNSSPNDSSSSRKISTFRPSFIANSSEIRRKSMQDRQEEIQKLISLSSQRRIKSHSLSPSTQTSEDIDDHQNSTIHLKFGSGSRHTSSHSISSDDEISLVSETSRATKSKKVYLPPKETKPLISKGNQKPERHNPAVASKMANVSPKKRISSTDSHSHKIPCAICGLHFSGDGLKLPHSHHNSLSVAFNDNHSQSSQDPDVVFCSFDCARLWGKTKPYHSHVHHSPSS